MTTSSSAQANAAGAVSQRQHILDTALTLMSQRGVDGTSMRDLAAATGLNVASLYHYFASKRELLVAVLQERGFIDDLAASPGPAAIARDDFAGLADVLDDMLGSMLEVEDFIRLMLGEVMRGEETAHGVGLELFDATQTALERWLEESDPALCANAGAPALARVLRSFLVGLFFEHLAGVVSASSDPDEVREAFRLRAQEVVAVLRAGR